MAHGCYWSVEDCAWRPSPARDALATPWSARGVDVWSWPFPLSAAEVLRSATPALPVPEQRPTTLDEPAELAAP